MSIGDFIRLFFVFSAIQPILRQQMLEVMRSRKISQIDRDRKSRVSFWAPARDSCACSASRLPAISRSTTQKNRCGLFR